MANWIKCTECYMARGRVFGDADGVLNTDKVVYFVVRKLDSGDKLVRAWIAENLYTDLLYEGDIKRFVEEIMSHGEE